MKKSFLLSLAFLVVFSAGVLLVWFETFYRPSARGGESQPVEVYFADNISTGHRRVIDEFNRLHEGRIRVIPVDLPFNKFSTNERKELLARSLRSKSEKLDVFAVDLIWVPRFARWCEPLDAAFPPAAHGRLLSYALESCVVDKAMMAAPMYIDVGLMYYRKDIIRRLPDAAAVERKLARSMTWDEFLALSKRLGYEGKPFYLFQAKDFEGLICNFLELARPAPGQKGFNLQSPESRRALNLMCMLVQTGLSPRQVTEFDENLSYRYMLDNNAVAVRGWPNFVENFRTDYGDTVKLLNLERAPIPHWPGAAPGSVFGGWNLMVSKSSKKKEEAIEFIRFFETETAQRIMFEAGGFIPIINSIYADSAYLRSHRELVLYYGLVNQGFHRPALVEYTQISDIISHFLHLAISGEMTPGEALERADRMIRDNEVLIK